MTVEQLKKQLETFPPDSIVILTDPDGIGWDNIGEVYLSGEIVKITMDGTRPTD